ncbi:MAG: S8 family serine peptidase [Acidobacteria bacterium]|nr:S8 family serine peptidase [Acidobacteriota bacterium]
MSAAAAGAPNGSLFASPRTCGLCQTDLGSSGLVPAGVLPPEVLLVVLRNNPWWEKESGLCTSCALQFQKAPEELREKVPGYETGACPILPTALRLNALSSYAGRGVTVAFLDSGFFSHPDLIEPRDRILAYVDVTDAQARRRDLDTPDDSSWHGMMTSVVACGNGRLSDGLYSGLASESKLVLVKVGSARRIKHDDIRRGLEWVLANRKRYRIRVVNVSCGGDYEASYLTDELSQAAERLARAGVLVCAAAGNLGHHPRHPILPPASAPSVLTVGGLDDKNRLSPWTFEMYHGSYGPTVDGLQKPEVLAPGIWVAAPILPGTPTAAQAELLSRLADAPDQDLRALIEASPAVDRSLDEAAALPVQLLRQLVSAKLRDNKVISGAYKHVDGTSFAAPIVSSVAAQMLEANPKLRPFEVKSILVRTAKRLRNVPVDRQGWGIVDARAAVEAALAAGAPEGNETEARAAS